MTALKVRCFAGTVTGQITYYYTTDHQGKQWSHTSLERKKEEPVPTVPSDGEGYRLAFHHHFIKDH